jgi:hypothetical protein
MEKEFFRTVHNEPVPLYASDIEDSTFKLLKTFKLSKADSYLKYISNIKGVNTPMMYIGSWKTSFQMHIEDMNLGALN